MCGIAGIWLSQTGLDANTLVREMTEALRHRGPSERGYWHGAEHGVALGHARLSILDLSPAGSQPMVSHSGRHRIVFNGEIYNHLELRAQLEKAGSAPPWRGHSDTETLLAAIDHLGVEATIQRAHGAFAFAVWDSELRRLTLARDRFGEKPLYWATTPRAFLFGSELKALIKSGVIDLTLSKDAAASVLRYNHVPAPHTVFSAVHKLMPGHLVELHSPDAVLAPRPYWSVQDVWTQAHARPFLGTDEEAIEETERLLSRVICGQMLSDVPLGAFLSGGVDSSAVVALMQAASTRPVQTFSIGFREAAFNEAESAKAIASHLGTEHHELYVTPADALDVIPKLPDIYCEPFADSSQIPTYLVAAFARHNVTVALTGDGGDEVFGGYNRYRFNERMFARLARLPSVPRGWLGALLDAPAPAQWDSFASYTHPFLPKRLRFSALGDKLHKFSRALPARSPAELYESFLCHWWPSPSRVVPGSSEANMSAPWPGVGLEHLTLPEQMMLQDARGYLPNDILVKLDRATMAVSMEGRVPFLDHELYAFAAALPLSKKIRGGTSKWILRQVLHRYVPAELMDRAKSGFAIPLDRWLRGELRDWGESLLSKQALQSVGMFDARIVREAWHLHLSGRRNLQNALWCVLMYQAWHARWMT